MPYLGPLSLSSCYLAQARPHKRLPLEESDIGADSDASGSDDEAVNGGGGNTQEVQAALDDTVVRLLHTLRPGVLPGANLG